MSSNCHSAPEQRGGAESRQPLPYREILQPLTDKARRASDD